jgi:hypothetical protein
MSDDAKFILGFDYPFAACSGVATRSSNSSTLSSKPGSSGEPE